MLRTRSVAVAAAATASALVLASCGSDGGDADSTSSEGAIELGGGTVEVKGGTEDKAPTVTVESEEPLSATDTEKKVVTEGEGEAIADDALVQVDLAMFRAGDGKAVSRSETYSAKPTVLDLKNTQQLAGLAKAIRGSKVGEQGTAVIPPKDLFGEEGMPDLGITGEESLILVYDVRSVIPPQPEGAEVAPKSGQPKVTYKDDAPASFTMPKTAAPKKLVKQPLITGEGEKVEEGQTVYVSYTGALWRNGKVFDSTKQEGRGPFPFQVGGGQVIKAWDEGLVGQPVGSRVLLVVPPADGYGKQGNPQGGIKGTDTLVFVIDILAAT